MTEHDITLHTIKTLLMMLEVRLINACELTGVAIDAMGTSQNQAVGTILPLKTELDTLRALYEAVLTLHQMAPTTHGAPSAAKSRH